ncbi:hypothetical protein [Streptomyces sp. NBC_00347]|uniref:hypothetical protein n=1 Tax=Streptomyces sp. NBC_00347 TaxID=2975721 RepID=UPI0022541B6A|nr:hypothetical protein [Streptomyces sp. NBC_00347]MCX5126813.1 hypothetical protein [Streptomyces sp. NBC_00347]
MLTGPGTDHHLEHPITEPTRKKFQDLTVDEYEQLCDDLTAPLTKCDRIHDELNLLTSDVRQISYTVGADTQNKITPLVLQTEVLARASAELLTQFNHPRYTSMHRRTWVLESMHALVRDTAQASLALSTALRDNAMPADAAPAPQPAAMPQGHHAAAEYEMAWHLAGASNLLDDGALACRNVYDWVVWDLDVADQAPNQRNTAYVRAAREAAARTAVAEAPAASAPWATPRR